MHHRGELALHQFMQKASKGESSFSDKTISQVGQDVMDAIKRQFGGGQKRGAFRLRMSNIGRPSCQLWYDKNKPEVALPFSKNFMMNMMLGDIVEAVFKGLLKEAGVQYEDSKKVTLELPSAKIDGSYDVDDELDYINAKIQKLNNNEFERCYEPEKETFRGKDTGNTIINKHCSFCSYRFDCWENLKELPSVMSKAKMPKMVGYVELIEANHAT